MDAFFAWFEPNLGASPLPCSKVKLKQSDVELSYYMLAQDGFAGMFVFSPKIFAIQFQPIISAVVP